MGYFKSSDGKGKFKISIALLVFLVSLTIKVAGQDIPAMLKTIIPPSPEVSSLGKFGDIPVGLHTGVPQISIPIYTIKNKDIEFPISIDYSAAGIRVNEIASSVGLGFALNAGGVIFANVNGLPDLGATGFVNTSHPDFSNFNPDYYQNPPNSHYTYAKSVTQGDIDSEPDIFHYNFLGRSGKFTFDRDRQIWPIPFEKIKIEYTPTNGEQFKITDEYGFQFFYATKETVETRTSGCGGGEPQRSDVVNTFKLVRMRSPQGAQVVINYHNFPSYEYRLGEQRTDYFLSPPLQSGCPSFLPGPNFCTVKSLVTSSLISSIVSSNGVRLDFEYSDLLPMIINGSPETERRDLKNTYSLRRIKVSSSAGVVEKQIALNFDYHQSPGAPAAFAEGSHEYYRLLLESVTEEGKAPYQLFYNTTTPTQMPMRLSASVDKWGYFNGASNGNLLPQLDEILGLGIVSGANRDVNIDYNQALILNKIKYPTGGVSEFYYEPNYYDEVGLRLRPFLNPREVGVSSFGSSPVLSNTFNITNQPYTPAITFTSQGCSSNNQEIGSNCRVLLKNNTTGTPPIFYGASDGNILLVQNNNYTFSVLSDGCDCAAHLHWKEREDLWVNVNERHYVGGVRIGRVVGDPMDGNSSFEKSYFYTNPTTGHSSGHVQFEPSFTYNLTSHNNLLDDPQKPLRCDFLARVGASVVPLSYVQGNSIGYEYVTELIGVGGQGGKTVTRFKLMNDIGGVGAIPFTPVTSYEWLRGLMESETKYRYDPSDPINPFRQVSNVYHQYEVKHSLEEPNVANEQKIQGLKILQKSAEFWTPKNPLLLIPATFSYARYYNISAWYFRKKTIEQQNDSKTSDQFIERETNYYYLNPIHAQISKLENLTTGKKQIVSYTYPADYSLVSTGVLASMKSDERNMHGIPIEKITSQWVDGRGEEIVSGQFTSYDFIGYDNPITPEDERLILPVKLESTELSAVKPKNDFISSLLSGEAADNSYSIRQEVTYYPNTGNVKEILSIKNPPSTLLWGYANSQIVAEVRNATYEQVKNALGGESVVNDVAQNATLSPTQIALLNGLRQNPLLSKSLITTYTHDPLAGILTKTDANGQTLYYNYDDAGRIKEIRDSYQDLIKLYKYHYKD